MPARSSARGRRAGAFRQASAAWPEGFLLVHLPDDITRHACALHGAAQRAAHEGGVAVTASWRHLRGHAHLALAAALQGRVLRVGAVHRAAYLAGLAKPP